MASDNVGELKIALSFDEKTLDTSVDKVESKMNTMAGSIQMAIGVVMAHGLEGVVGKLKSFASSIVEVGMSFESSMSNVAAISGATGEEIAALTAKAREMGANTRFSASEAADALGYMAMAGWKTDQMLGGLDGVMSLAAASGADLATTSDIVTDALTGFGESADQAGKLADIMAAASSNANTNVELMGETFKYITPIAGSLGYSMEDTALAIGLMANAGVKGTQAGTALRSIMQRLATDMGATNKTLGAQGVLVEELGVAYYNADGTVRDFSDMIVDLRGVWKNLTATQQANYANTIAGAEAMSGFLAIVNAGEEDFAKLSDAITNSDGAAEKMAETMQDNLDGDLASLNSKLEELQIKLFEAVQPALRGAVEIAGGFADGIGWVMDNINTLLPILGGLTAAVAAYELATKGALIATGLWEGATKLAAVAQTALNAVLNMNPLGVVIGLIAGVTTALGILFANSEDFRNFLGDFFGFIGVSVQMMTEEVAKFFGFIGEQIGNFFNSVGEAMSKMWNDMVNAGGNIVKGLWEGISGATGWLWNKVTDFCAGILDAIKNFFGIHSPSRVFEDEIGAMLAEGIGVGFTVEMKDVSAEMTAAIPTPASDSMDAWSSAIDTIFMDEAPVNNTEEEMTIIQNINLYNDWDIEQVGDALQQEARRVA